MISFWFILFLQLFHFSLGAPPGQPPTRSRGQSKPSSPTRNFGRSSRLPSIDPGPQMGRSRQRPSMGAIRPPLQEQLENVPAPIELENNLQPGSFPDSPGFEDRRPQVGRAFQPGFGPESVPFNVEDGIFDSRQSNRPLPQNENELPEDPNQMPSNSNSMQGRRDGDPILPVRPNSLTPQSNDLEESIPPPPSEENEGSSANGPDPMDESESNPNPINQGNQPLDDGNGEPVDPNLGPQTPGRGPILPIRPPARGNTGDSQNWNISDAEAAGLINGEDLNASQEGRCVVCGPRNQFSVVDPIAAQTARPNQIPDTSYEDETEAGPSPRIGRPNRPYSRPLNERKRPDRLKRPPMEMFPSPEDLRLGDLAELAVNSLIRTCRTKIDCQVQPFGSQQKRNDIHRSELEMQKRYTPYESPKAVERRLDKVHAVKMSILNAAGLAKDVLPTNDGAFQQDILLTEDQAEYLLHKLRLPSNRAKRGAIYMELMPAQHWEFGKPIAYTFDPSMDARDRRVIQLALRAIETSTCIRFIEYPTRPPINHIYYVKIATPTFCGLSYIGKISPANPIYLSFACGDPIGVAVHETMHALGVTHEHLRVDRDKYLQMQWDNINPQYFDYFAISDPLAFTSYGVPFDFESIMMYGPFTGAVDPNRPSIQPLNDDGTKFAKMGQRKRLSRADILLLNRMYCRPPSCVDRNVFCGTWSLRSLCVGAPQSAWMQRHCRRSCNFC